MFFKIACAGLMLILPVTSNASRDVSETVYKKGVVADDYYAAGETVNLDAQIEGDATVAGGDVLIGREIQGDLLAAGGTLKIRGSIGDDIRSAGGTVDVDAVIGDDLIASGGKVHVSADSLINGNAWLAGGDVQMAGTVKRDLIIGAGSILISGTVNGDVDLSGGDIKILEGARIEGNLHYNSPHPATIHSAAIIDGNVTHSQVDWDDQSGAPGGLFFVITLTVAGIVLFLVFPGFTVSAAARAGSEPWKSLGIGLLLLLVTPLVTIILMGIVLGVWVGLALMLLYFVALLTGFLIACFAVGDWGARLVNTVLSSKGRRILSLIIAIVVIGLLKLLPVIGGLLLFILLLLGMGAGFLQLRHAYRQPTIA